jgi:phospholipid/cholesterol/gamma-HCH transport system substrate-binding protein
MRRTAAMIVALVVLASAFASCGRDRGYVVRATFDDVGDLQADADVGLTKDFRAEVTMTIERGRDVPRDSIALLRTTSLLGEKFIELRPNGDPAAGPYLQDGDRLAKTAEAPELEFVAQEAIDVLGSVVASDVAGLIEAGAASFGGRGEDLNALIADLAGISRTLASRTAEIQRIIDGLDATTATLAASSGDIADLLSNLATTTQVLADNRQRALTTLDQLSRLARVQNDLLVKYRSDIDRQIDQVDEVLAVAAGQTAELSLLVQWLEQFVVGTPKVVPGDFAQVYGWFIPEPEDTRPDGPAGNRPGVTP